nr:tetratricopeptide repeat protein [Brevundimonas variabilis]
MQTRLTEAEARGAAEATRFQAQLIEAREALVADLASRDRAYAEEIAVFRREVTTIASTPEGANALARFNAGDRVGAIAVLDRLRRARDVARQTRANIESAAEARQIATLALDARGKSDPAFDTGAVIARYEEVVRLDAGEYLDWLQLFKLYANAGRRADALAAAERLEALASNDQNRSVALAFKGDLLLSQGDRDGALVLFRRGLEISERLSRHAPESTALSGNVGAALIKIGDVLLSQGDRDDALAYFRKSLEIAERLSAAEPEAAIFARYMTASLERTAIVLLNQGDPDGALGLHRRALEVRERLSEADPESADKERDVGVSLDLIADVLSRQGNSEGALENYRRSLEIDERLSAADPASAVLARAVSVSMERIGKVLLGLGDRAGALGLYRRSLEIRERLLAADPAAADKARDVFVSYLNMAAVTGERLYAEQSLAILRDLEAKGALAEGGRPLIAQLEEVLARFGAPAT